MHAEVVRRADGYCIVDLGARSGTHINGTPVHGSAPLHPGDHIRLGRTTIVVDGDTAPPVDITPTPFPTGPGTTLLGPGEIGPPPTGGPAGLMDIVREADRLMLFHRPLEEIFESILNLAGHTFGCERAALMILEDGRLVPKAVRRPRSEQGVPISLCGAIVERVLSRRESILTSDALRDPRFDGSRSLADARIRSVMCVPVCDDVRVLGLLYLDNREESGIFTEQDLRALAHLASVAAVKIENARLFSEALRARLLEGEILQAAAIQEHLLPAEPAVIPGYEVCGRSIPCRSVGGDSYDYIALPEGRHILTLGDVTGKGLAAALLMCCFHSTLRAVAAGGFPVAETATRLNRLLHARFPPARFTTCFLGMLDPARHEISFVNAGQETPFLIRRAADPLPLPPAGLPLGMFEDSRYETGCVTLDPGDVLLCYSDGVTEGTNPREEMFGHGRLLAAAAGAAGGPAAAILDAITVALERHRSGRPHEDDITLLVARRLI
jgi:sigma-B regulation protein RsbU (phosphoserine phosphatase)